MIDVRLTQKCDGPEQRRYHVFCSNNPFCNNKDSRKKNSLFVRMSQEKDVPNTSSTAQGGGGSFKNRKPIGEIGCCESPMAEQKH